MVFWTLDADAGVDVAAESWAIDFFMLWQETVLAADRKTMKAASMVWSHRLAMDLTLSAESEETKGSLALCCGLVVTIHVFGCPLYIIGLVRIHTQMSF